MSIQSSPQQGQDVLVLLPETAPGQVFAGTVARIEPLTLRFIGETPLLSKGEHVTVVYKDQSIHHKLGCDVLDWNVRKDTLFCELRVATRVELERRRSRRVPANLPCSLSFVAGVQTEVGHREGTLADLSMHGARVCVDFTPEPGSLFHLVIPVEGEPPIRALSLCTRRDGNAEMGLEFVDFIGDSAATLKRLVSRLRASSARS